MGRLVALLVVLTLLPGCAPRKMTPEQIASQKSAIESLVSNFWTAYGSKDLATVTKAYTSSNDLLCFGTDSAEIIRTIPQVEAMCKSDWELFESVKFGTMKNVSTLVSSDGALGSITCEMPADITVGGQQTHSLFRFGGTVRKENGQWRFVHGLIAVATVGQSSAELVAKMKAEPNDR